MNAPEGTIKAYLSRARKELKELLKEDYFYADNLNHINIPKEKLNTVVNENLAVIRKNCRRKRFISIVGKSAAAVAVIAAVTGLCMTTSRHGRKTDPARRNLRTDSG